MASRPAPRGGGGGGGEAGPRPPARVGSKEGAEGLPSAAAPRCALLEETLPPRDAPTPSLCELSPAETRRYIADGKCACPLANQWLNNVLLTPRHMLRVLHTLLVTFNRAPRGGPERAAREVRPADVRVRISGTRPRRALVMRKLGTIPEDGEAELPVFEE
mgnify:CR=1 FL=1